MGVILGYGMAVVAGQVRGEVTGQFTGVGGALSYIPPYFTQEIFVTNLVFAITISMIAGAYPAWRASKLDPVVALRKE